MKITASLIITSLMFGTAAFASADHVGWAPSARPTNNPTAWIPQSDGGIADSPHIAAQHNTSQFSTTSSSRIAISKDNSRQLLCEPTPYQRTSNYPGSTRIITSNKLAKPTGKSQFAEGQLIMIQGKLRDSKCVPLRNARIEIWQTNPSGYYRYASPAQLATPFPTFAGNGVAYSDNEGNYSFMTMFPGSNGKKAPHVNFRITSDYTRPMDTTMFFEGDARNAEDPLFKTFRDKKRAALSAPIEPTLFGKSEAELVASFDIVAPGRDAFRDY